MRRRAFVALLAIVTIAGCHKEGPSGPFAGHWAGSDGVGVNLDITLKDAPDGSVTGSGTLFGPAITGTTIPVTINGSETGGSCSVTVDAPPYTHADLAGPMTNGVWTAALNGSGFVNDTLTLTKQ